MDRGQKYLVRHSVHHPKQDSVRPCQLSLPTASREGWKMIFCLDTEQTTYLVADNTELESQRNTIPTRRETVSQRCLSHTQMKIRMHPGRRKHSEDHNCVKHHHDTWYANCKVEEGVETNCSFGWKPSSFQVNPNDPVYTRYLFLLLLGAVNVSDFVH